jgi:cytochrome c553
MNRLLLNVLIAGSAGFAAASHAAGDAAAGQAKAPACATCHGPNGQGTQVAPKLAGEDTAKFIQALDDYKSGKKDNALMKMQTAPLSDADIANLAAYYASIR